MEMEYSSFPVSKASLLLASPSPLTTHESARSGGSRPCNGWMDGGREGWMEGWRDGGMEGWRDGRKEGWIKGRKDGTRCVALIH